ncbi:MAG: hypothetical protein JW963_13520 [Anaerolineales bacterium]|nr:hypothetical protein [Anaerolineales bacterium]
MPPTFRQFAPHRWTIGLLAAILISCAAPTDIPPTATSIEISPTATESPAPTETPFPSPTAVRTPPALPDIYISKHLNPLDAPHSYIEDTCEYLKNRWDPNNAAPGTVVMIVKLHGIIRNEAKSSEDVTVGQFERMIENIQEQGFEAINSEQLANFLESNEKIPPRSVVLLQDGRRTAENFNHRFRPYWEAWGWPVVNAWIIQTNTPASLIQDNLTLEQEGFVDHQLYSPLQRYSDNASEEYLSGELKKYTDIFEDRYDKAPIAIIWPDEPGINFPKAARRTGFRLGFTSNARGPVMYNWVPLADRNDPSRPAYYPEDHFNDPLMTLPRYWPLQVIDQLDQVRLTGKDAAAYAEQNKEIELEYYDIVCAPTYGLIPGNP